MQDDTPKRSGTFCVAKDRKVNGTLSLAGLDTSLDLSDSKPFYTERFSGTTITGDLDDRTKVSLIKFFVTSWSFESGSHSTVHKRRIAPHYVVIGEQHFFFEGRDVHEI